MRVENRMKEYIGKRVVVELSSGFREGPDRYLGTVEWVDGSHMKLINVEVSPHLPRPRQTLPDMVVNISGLSFSRLYTYKGEVLITKKT